MTQIIKVEDRTAVPSGQARVPVECARARDLVVDALFQLFDPEIEADDLKETTLVFLSNWHRHAGRCSTCRIWGKKNFEALKAESANQ